MSSIHPMFYIQTVLFSTLSFLCLLSAASTSLSQMFIPAAQRQAHHLPILRLLAITDILHVLNELDPYGVFGIYSSVTAHFFQVQVVSFLVDVFACALHQNFKTLYTLTQRPVPRYLAYVIWTVPILHHISKTVESILEFTLIDMKTADTAYLSKFVTVRVIPFNIASAILIIQSLVLVLQLRVTIRDFIRGLEHMEKIELEALKAAKETQHPTTPKQATSSSAQDESLYDASPDVENNNHFVASGIRARIVSIQSTTRQVIFGSISFTIVLAATFGINASRLRDIAHNSLGREQFATSDPSVYDWTLASSFIAQMIALTLLTWYVWRSPMLWLRPRYSFRTTLLYGLEFAQAEEARKNRMAKHPNLETPTSSEEFYNDRHKQLPKLNPRAKLVANAHTLHTNNHDDPSFLSSSTGPFVDALGNFVSAADESSVQPQHQQLQGSHQALPYICPPTVQTTTRQIPVPPFNSLVTEETRIKEESQFELPAGRRLRHVVQIHVSDEYPAVVLGESKLLMKEASTLPQ